MKYTLEKFPLDDKAGITVLPDRYEVDFIKRGYFFTEFECEILARTGLISAVGVIQYWIRPLHADVDERAYNASLDGHNSLFYGMEDFFSADGLSEAYAYEACISS